MEKPADFLSENGGDPAEIAIGSSVVEIAISHVIANRYVLFCVLAFARSKFDWVSS